MEEKYLLHLQSYTYVYTFFLYEKFNCNFIFSWAKAHLFTHSEMVSIIVIQH